jgi:hypothetical protein
MREAGWMHRGEAAEDYDAVVAELFDDDGRWRNPPDQSVARADG